MGEGELTEQDDPSRFHRVLGDAISALEGAAVPYVLFGSIAAGVYGKPEQSGDIDLLIERAGVRPALDALSGAGFDTEETDPTWLSKAFRDGVMVDLMTQLVGGLFLDDEMRSHARRMDLAGTRSPWSLRKTSSSSRLPRTPPKARPTGTWRSAS